MQDEQNKEPIADTTKAEAEAAPETPPVSLSGVADKTFGYSSILFEVMKIAMRELEHPSYRAFLSAVAQTFFGMCSPEERDGIVDRVYGKDPMFKDIKSRFHISWQYVKDDIPSRSIVFESREAAERELAILIETSKTCGFDFEIEPHIVEEGA